MIIFGYVPTTQWKKKNTLCCSRIPSFPVNLHVKFLQLFKGPCLDADWILYLFYVSCWCTKLVKIVHVQFLCLNSPLQAIVILLWYCTHLIFEVSSPAPFWLWRRFFSWSDCSQPCFDKILLVVRTGHEDPSLLISCKNQHYYLKSTADEPRFPYLKERKSVTKSTKSNWVSYRIEPTLGCRPCQRCSVEPWRSLFTRQKAVSSKFLKPLQVCENTKRSFINKKKLEAFGGKFYDICRSTLLLFFSRWTICAMLQE